MKRKVIRIDEEKCTGCGLCIPNCPEGAIAVIDGKARLVGDLLCDGLGACLGHCPEGAIAVEEREAEPYDERRVMENVVRQGPNVIAAHLEHLRSHDQQDDLRQAQAYLAEHGIEIQGETASSPPVPTSPPAGCPGRLSRQMAPRAAPEADDASPSQLRHWPVQLHLVSPSAPQYRGADLLLAADCTAYAAGDFHARWLKGRALSIACPKLDAGREVYVEKLRALIDEAQINTLTVLMMEVPCCSGLVALARQAAAAATRKVPIKAATLRLDGTLREAAWV